MHIIPKKKSKALTKISSTFKNRDLNKGEEKKKPLSQFCHLRQFVFDQSSPAHFFSESRVGGLSVTYTAAAAAAVAWQHQ